MRTSVGVKLTVNYWIDLSSYAFRFHQWLVFLLKMKESKCWLLEENFHWLINLNKTTSMLVTTLECSFRFIIMSPTSLSFQCTIWWLYGKANSWLISLTRMKHQNLSYSKLSIGQLIKMLKWLQWEAEIELYDKLFRIAKNYKNRHTFCF